MYMYILTSTVISDKIPIYMQHMYEIARNIIGAIDKAALFSYY